MSDEQKAPDVRVLEDRYQILGELRGAAGPQTYIGKRRADGADVFIRVIRGAKDDNNALAHLASDAQILTGVDHANVLRVLESRWLGPDTMAIVNERVRGRTLGEMLSTGDVPSHQHAAVILDDVRSALDWAREHGIVHRGVAPDTLLFNDGDDRPLVLLSPTPIPMESIPDACEDARTIGTLSWAMLTGERFDGSESADELAERRPDLARRVIDDTIAMTACRNGGEVPDVANYLGVIANADALRQGEIEVARMEAELEEERRKEREAFEAEQRACEARVRETEEQLAAEREDFARRIKEEEARLADAHQQLDVERAQIEQERIEFDERSADLDRARAEVEAIRAEQERRVAEAVAAAVAATKAELRAQMPKKPSKFVLWGGGGDKPVNRPVPVLGDSADRDIASEADEKTLNDEKITDDEEDDVPSKSLRRPDDVSLVPAAVPAAMATTPRIVPPVGGGPRAVDENGRTSSAASSFRSSVVPSSRRPWRLPTAIVGALAIIIAITIGINHHENGSTPSVVRIGSTSIVPTAPAQQPGITPRGGFFTQSAGGTLAPRSMSPVLPTGSTPIDAPAPSQQPAISPLMPDTTRLDTANAKPKPSTPPEERRHERDAAESARQSQRPVTAPRDSLFSLPAPPARDSFLRRDTTVRPDTFTRPSTGARSDTVVHYGVPRPLRDTTVRRDTIVRPDTGLRPRPDTMSIHR